MWVEVSASSDVYARRTATELQDESGNALLDESGLLLIGDPVSPWVDQAGTGETWTDV